MLKKLKTVGKKISETSAQVTASATAFLAQKDLLKWTEELTQSIADKYDRALDRDYIEGIKKGIGGGNHRLFDGGHDILNAWQRAKEAASDDTFAQEVMGYMSALWKDVTTTKGLPFATLEKATYDEWTNKIASWIPGVNKEYLADLVSFDALEVVSTSLGILGVVFALKKDDKEKLAEILGSMGIVSIASANPIMGICAVALGAYAYFVKKKELDKKAMVTSASLAAVSSIIFAALGIPVLIELAIVLVVSNLLKKHLFNNDQVLAIIKQNVSAAGKQSATILLNLTEKLSEQLKQVAKKKVA